MRHYHTGEGRYCERIQKHIYERVCELSRQIFVWKQTSRPLRMTR